jgi:hypothetical protein
MTQDDALTLLFAVCGCSTASKAGANIEGWRQSRRFDGSDAYADSGFAFMRELTFIEALRTLLVSDLSANGAVSRFAAESDAHALEMRYPAQLHELTVSFDVDGYSGSIELQRVLIDTGAREVGRQRSFARYGLMLDVTRSDNFIRVRDHGFAADSKLVRQLGEKNLRGWRRYALELVD